MVCGLKIVMAVAAVLTVGAAAAQSNIVPSNTLTPVLVELFTSEGCSSCPPADDLLGKLNGLKTDHGQVIVALSEHVTYWNQLGWSDPYSAEIFTERQNTYGDRFHLDSVYTPQIVVNGDREVLGSDRDAVLTAVNVQSGMSKETLKIDSVVLDNEALVVTYEASGPMPVGKVQIFAALADDLDSSQVARGENAGRVLKHVAVARSLVSFGTLQTGSPAVIRLPAAARGPRQPGAPMHIGSLCSGGGTRAGACNCDECIASAAADPYRQHRRCGFTLEPPLIYGASVPALSSLIHAMPENVREAR